VIHSCLRDALEIVGLFRVANLWTESSGRGQVRHVSECDGMQKNISVPQLRFVTENRARGLVLADSTGCATQVHCASEEASAAPKLVLPTYRRIARG
jgi:hypothetical protein